VGNLVRRRNAFNWMGKEANEARVVDNQLLWKEHISTKRVDQ